MIRIFFLIFLSVFAVSCQAVLNNDYHYADSDIQSDTQPGGTNTNQNETDGNNTDSDGNLVISTDNPVTPTDEPVGTATDDSSGTATDDPFITSTDDSDGASTDDSTFEPLIFDFSTGIDGWRIPDELALVSTPGASSNYMMWDAANQALVTNFIFDADEENNEAATIDIQYFFDDCTNMTAASTLEVTGSIAGLDDNDINGVTGIQAFVLYGKQWAWAANWEDVEKDGDFTIVFDMQSFKLQSPGVKLDCVLSLGLEVVSYVDGHLTVTIYSASVR